MPRSKVHDHERIRALLESGLKPSQIAERLGCSYPTIQKVKKEIGMVKDNQTKSSGGEK